MKSEPRYDFTKEATYVRQRCWDLLKQWGFEFLNTTIGGWGSKNSEELNFCMNMKFAAIYRIEAVAFNLGILSNIAMSHTQRYVQNQFDDRATPELIHEAGTKQLYQFDNIIFNLVSMYDYIANLAGYQYIGRNASRWKWKGLIYASRSRESAREKYGGRLCVDEGVADYCRSLDSEWVNKLSERRARVYHDRPDSSPVAAIMDFNNFSHSEISVRTPVAFRKWIERATGAPDGLGESILAGTSWAVLRSFETVEDILKLLIGTVPEAKSWRSS